MARSGGPAGGGTGLREAELGYYTGVNPAAGVARYKIPRKRPEFHTEDERDALLEAAEVQAHGPRGQRKETAATGIRYTCDGHDLAAAM